MSLINTESLRTLFDPQSVAIIGASSEPTKIGGRPIDNMKIAGFQGRIIPVNARSKEIQGLPAVPSLRDVAEPVDMAIVVVPQPAVLDAVTACVEKGVKSAIILSSGFAEINEAGAKEQARVAAIAREGGLRIMGPNCMGTMNANTGMIATFANLAGIKPQTGGISVASQSGAFGAHCYTVMRERGYGMNLWATMGNQCDVDFSDCLAFMAQDPNTDVVMGYMEGITDAPRMLEALEIARAHKKPVVLMKVGTSDVGSAAAASHTASLTGSDAVFDAVLRDYDVYRARTYDEMFDVAYACSAKKFPTKRDLGVITVSGGVGVIMADAAADKGFDLPPLPESTQKRLKEMVPFAGTRNPLDVTAQLVNDPTIMQPMFESLLGDGGYTNAICFMASVGLYPTMMEKLQPAFEAVAKEFPDRLITFSALTRQETRQPLEELGYLVYEDPARAINAMAAMVHFGEAFYGGKVRQAPPALPAGAPKVQAGAQLNEFDAKKMLAAAGVPVVDERIVQSAEAAAAAAKEIGFPVVAKIVSPDIQHKSEIGGVLLNIADEAEAAAAFDTLMQRGRTAVPTARLEGVLFAPMVQGGVETIIGVQRDPVFGPVVMFGLGGIFVEVLKDVTFRLAPFGVDVAHEMIRSVRGYPMLEGVRGAPPADVDALAEALAAVSVFAAANAETLESIDLNPVLVRPRGEGCVAVDALIVATAD
ncbi:MAG: acetate--CoA ligase family protein [Alphaproteobacteria bacterium]|nr:acetate--CoA ligase family protein [Alphaproteobacteria bacterium]MCB9931629.1 acetate--CoA ligase family protein [Alphaproteobacteria bacterium]